MTCVTNRGKRDLLCKDNIGGIKVLYLFNFVPRFYTQIDVIEGVELISYPDTLIYRFELIGDFSFNQTINEDGDVNQSFECNLKKIDLETTEQLNKLSRQLVGAIVKLRSGKYALLGLRNGVDVGVNTTTGAGRTEFSGYNFSLTALEDYQAPLFNSLDIGFIDVEGDFLLQENGDYLLQENDFKIKL